MKIHLGTSYTAHLIEVHATQTPISPSEARIIVKIIVTAKAWDLKYKAITPLCL